MAGVVLADLDLGATTVLIIHRNFAGKEESESAYRPYDEG